MHRGPPQQRTLETLSVDDCLRLLASRYVGRIAFVFDGRIELLPVNYVVYQGSIVFRIGYGGALEGVFGQWVAFEIDDIDETYHTGWSVVVHGKAEEVWQPADLDAMRALPLRPWAPGERDHYVRVLSTAVTGRQIT
jgi:uncharacterized protein